MKGILNGIDTEINDPSTDKLIQFNYDVDNLGLKYENKKALQEYLGLPEKNVPLISMVSRLTDQKGLDILSPALEELMHKELQMVVVGTGEAKYEDTFKYFSWKYPDKMSAQIKFDVKLAQEVYAGSDMILI